VTGLLRQRGQTKITVFKHRKEETGGGGKSNVAGDSVDRIDNHHRTYSSRVTRRNVSPKDGDPITLTAQLRGYSFEKDSVRRGQEAWTYDARRTTCETRSPQRQGLRL